MKNKGICGRIKNYLFGAIVVMTGVLLLGFRMPEVKASYVYTRTFGGYTFTDDIYGNTRCFDSYGNSVINEFKCDGVYTYYFQADGTAMKDRLTYHPDGANVIYFDESGHEVFSDFHHVKKSIAGEAVDDYCFFDVYGHMYVDVLTYDKSGAKIYYANPYGRLEIGKWFQFSDNVKWADGTQADGNKGQYGYANADGTLMTNQYTYDWLGQYCYMQGNGTVIYPAQPSSESSSSSYSGSSSNVVQSGSEVYITDTGKCYHSYSGCRGLNRAKSLAQVDKAYAQSIGLRACNICW